jgi:uncharacterized membrane protein YfcA
LFTSFLEDALNLGRQVFEFLQAASAAHARWDLEVSTNILRSRKRLFILLLLLLPILAVAVCEAAILGGEHAYAPATYSTKIFLVSIVIGLCAGLITGCIGAGGGFIITPALMAAGVKGILAVGTDLFHIFAKAIMGTAIHRKLGNVSVKLAAAFLVGSALGTVLGGTVNKAIYNINPLLSNLFISLVYSFLLGFLGFYGLYDFLRASRGTRKSAPRDSGQGAHSGGAGMTGVAVKLQHLHIPPMLTFDEDLGGRRISAVVVMLGGLIVGTLAALMGVGGGFVTFPMFVYIFGVSSMTTVGTDILQIIVTAGLGAVGQYAIYGFVFYSLAMGMLLGSLIGIQVGALTTKVVRGIHIRGFYAVSILAGFVNRAATLPKQVNDLEILRIPSWISGPIDLLGTIVFWAVTGFFGLWVLSKFFGNLKELREE